MPRETGASQERVLQRIRAREAEDLVAHIRAVVARVDDTWKPICGRIDIARRADAPAPAARPVGAVRLLAETVSISDLVGRLNAAFQGNSFIIGSEAIAEHGMNSAWSNGGHHTDDWRDYGATWPVFCLAPVNPVTRHINLWEVIEAEGCVEAFDGSNECVGAVMGFGSRAGSVSDTRFSRFQIVEWDYRGVFHAKAKDGELRVEVQPGEDPKLKLSLVAAGRQKVARTKVAPSILEVPIDGPLLRANVTLRYGDEVVCEQMLDFRYDDGSPLGALRWGSSSPHVVAGAQDSVAQLAFGFLSDPKLATMVARDHRELDAALSAGASKAAVLLVGSILEAMLLDVLGRNQNEARARLAKKWPDKASLKELIDTAAGITVAMPNGTTGPLLPPLTGRKGLVVTDHRDLIHPRAEVRGEATIDDSTATTMRGVLGEVVRDLRQAHEQGILDEYAQGRVV